MSHWVGLKSTQECHILFEWPFIALAWPVQFPSSDSSKHIERRLLDLYGRQ